MRAVDTAYVEGTAAAATWRPWTIWLPSVVAFLWSGFLIFAEIVAVLLSNLSDRPRRLRRAGSIPRLSGMASWLGLVSSLL